MVGCYVNILMSSVYFSRSWLVSSSLSLNVVCCVCGCAAPVENGDTEMSTEEPWDQKEAEPNEEEPGGGDRGPEVQATTEETAQETMEEEEEAPVPKVPPTQPDAPRKEHINVVFIGHVGQCMHLSTVAHLLGDTVKIYALGEAK